MTISIHALCNGLILPVPTALESRVYREQTLVTGIHRCPDIEILGQQKNVAIQHSLRDITIATIIHFVDDVVVVKFEFWLGKDILQVLTDVIVRSDRVL